MEKKQPIKIEMQGNEQVQSEIKCLEQHNPTAVFVKDEDASSHLTEHTQHFKEELGSDQWCDVNSVKYEETYPSDGENCTLEELDMTAIESGVKQSTTIENNSFPGLYKTADPIRTDEFEDVPDYVDEMMLKSGMLCQLDHQQGVNKKPKNQSLKNYSSRNEVSKACSQPEDTFTLKTENQFSCAHCNYTAKCKRYLVRHMILHDETKMKLSSCTLCSYTTNYKRNLVRHMLVHSEGQKKPYSCTNCNYSTNEKSNLTRHMVVHDEQKEKTFFCDSCKFKTHRSSYLKAHTLKVHLESDKKLPCTFCKRYFKSKKSLDDHLLKNHPRSTESVSSKIHKCQSCDYKTTFSKELNRHITCHHSEVDISCYKCTSCRYNTYSKDSFIRHQNSHRKIEDSLYNPCCKGYARKDGLDYHIINVHRDDDELMAKVTSNVYSCTQCPFRTVQAAGLLRHKRKHKS